MVGNIFTLGMCVLAVLAGSLQIRAIDGRVFRPLEPAGLANVLIFVSTDCPVSNAYAPELQRICASYAAKGIACSLIYEDPKVTASDVRKHLDEYRYRAVAAAIDADGSLALIGADPTQAVADVQTLRRLVHERDPTPEAAADLRAIHRRYQGAPPPAKGEGTSLAYRLRLFSLDRGDRWWAEKHFADCASGLCFTRDIHHPERRHRTGCPPDRQYCDLCGANGKHLRGAASHSWRRVHYHLLHGLGGCDELARHRKAGPE